MNEAIYVDSFVRSVLTADAELTGASGLNATAEVSKIYPRRAPQRDTEEDRQALSPYVLYTQTGGRDFRNWMRRERLIVESLVWARVVSRGAPTAAARFAAHRVDEVLKAVHRAQRTFDSQVWTFNTWRERADTREVEGETDEVVYVHNGGFYWVQMFRA